MSIKRNKSHRNGLAIIAIVAIIVFIFQLKPDWNVQPHTKDILFLEFIVILLAEILYLFKNFNK